MRLRLAALLLALPCPALAQLPVASSADESVPDTPSDGAISEEGGRILGGTSAILGDIPWQVQVYWIDPGPDDPKNPRPAWQRAHRCGGALITPEWVLTAAHCFFSSNGKVRYEGKEFSVRTGLVSLENPPAGSTHAIRANGLVVHPGYIPCKACAPAKAGTVPLSPAHQLLFTHDLALIRLASPVKSGRTVAPIARLQTQPAVNKPVTASGWGAASNPDKREFKFQPALQKVGLSILICGTEEGVLPTHICAGGIAGKDTCVGDSGGPLASFTPQGAMLVGITSRRPIGESNCGGSAARAIPETRYSSVTGDNYAWISSVLAAAGVKW